jgi:glycosyltransferase involved in cell wall biosynthesis
MRVIIIDPYLKSQEGHPYNYTSSIKTELQNRHIQCFVLGNEHAADTCLQLGNFYPYLPEIISKAFDMTRSPIAAVSVMAGILNLKRRFKSRLLKNSQFSLQQGDIIFAHTLYVFELLSLALFIRNQKKNLIEKNVVFVIGLNFRFIRSSGLLTKVLKTAYTYIYGRLLARSGVTVKYFCDIAGLAAEYEQLLGIKVPLLPVPLYPFPVDMQNQVVHDKLVVAYPGAARYNKGFDIFVESLARLIEEKPISDRITFYVQVYKQNQPSKELELTEQAINQLNETALKSNNIVLFNGPLTVTDYYRLLTGSDIIVLPYRDETFKVVGSSVFNETVIAGKIPVVPDNTSMETELKQNGITGLTFKSGDIDSLINTVKRVITGHAEYKQKIKPMQQKWILYQNAPTFVNMLLSMVK